LYPAFFISYSRHQSQFAQSLKTRLSAKSKNTWFDRDREEAGDKWFDEIVRGIVNCDETVLLLSDEAAVSEVVRREISAAEEHGKPVRPVLVASLTKALQPALAKFHYHDVSQFNEEERISAAIDYLSNPTPQPGEIVNYKRLSCRGIYLPFSANMLKEAGRSDVHSANAQLRLLRLNYPASSAMWLNAGLIACVADDWGNGLTLLREHAHAAGSFPGWYFYALHILRRQNVRRLHPDILREASNAILGALSVQKHPFAVLVAAILDAGNNMIESARRRMHEFVAASSQLREDPGEAMRAFWCLQPSLDELGIFAPQVKAYLKEIST
jgi:hypothetical protein